jgi:hypothetical protein
MALRWSFPESNQDRNSAQFSAGVEIPSVESSVIAVRAGIMADRQNRKTKPKRKWTISN